jgi:hypothetical protein
VLGVGAVVGGAVVGGAVVGGAVVGGVVGSEAPVVEGAWLALAATGEVDGAAVVAVGRGGAVVVTMMLGGGGGIGIEAGAVNVAAGTVVDRGLKAAAALRSSRSMPFVAGRSSVSGGGAETLDCDVR